MSIINNATVEMVQNVINGNTPPTYANEAERTSNSFTVVLNGSTRTFNGSENVNLGNIYAPTSSGASGQVLVSNGGAGQAPSWQTDRITSVQGSTARGQAIYPPTSRGNDGYVWTSNGSNQNPSWQEPIVTSVQGSSGAGQSIYPPTSMGTDGYLWESNGSSVPSWQQPIITKVNGATTRGREVFAPTSYGDSGQVCVSNGIGRAPSWSSNFGTVRQSVSIYAISGDIYNGDESDTGVDVTLYGVRSGDGIVWGGYIDDWRFLQEDQWLRIKIPDGTPVSVTVTPRRGDIGGYAPEYSAFIDDHNPYVYMACDEATGGDDHWGAFFTIVTIDL